MYRKTIRAIASCALLCTGFMQAAHAYEGGVAPYPAGAEVDYIAAMPPIPGLFVMQQFNESFSNGLYGNDGKKLPTSFHTSIFSETTRLLAAYPLTVLGAKVYSQLVVPVVSLHSTVQGYKTTQNGLANITVSPVILQWTIAQNLRIAAGVDLSLETGSYSPSKTSVASGYTSIQPVLSIRYDRPDSIDIGLSNRLLINEKNSDTNYKSGTGYTGQFHAGWHLGRWEVGAVGYYVNQFSNDEQNGIAVSGNGNRMRSIAVGPAISYNAGPVNISLNYQQGIYAANTSKSNNVWLNLAIPLWVLSGHH